MRYDLGGGIIVKSENAAKPASQPSKFLLRILADLPPVSTCFDYGCGKLRYLDAVARNSDTVVLVDSEVQLSRKQIVKGELTTIRDLLGTSNQRKILSDIEFCLLGEQFDRGFCINVLSIIPIIRTRKQVIELIYSKLKPGGDCLFVVQYRNSDFTRMREKSNARSWGDGFLMDSLRGYSFYAIITPDVLTKMVVCAGFQVSHRVLNDGSVYLFASVPR